MLEKIGTGSYATVYKALKKVRAVSRALPSLSRRSRLGSRRPEPPVRPSIVYSSRKRNARSRVKLHAMLSLTHLSRLSSLHPVQLAGG